MHSNSTPLTKSPFVVTYNTLALISVVTVLVSDIIVRINSWIGLSNGSTEAVLILQGTSLSCLLILVGNLRWKGSIPNSSLLFFKLFILWGLICFFRGVFNAQDYWDWRNLLLGYSFTIMIPFSIVIGLQYERFLIIFKLFVKAIFLISFIGIPYALTIDYELYPRFVIAVSLFLLFIPYVRLEWRIVIVTVAICSVIVDVSYRSNVVRILFPTVVLFSFYCKMLKKVFLNSITVLLFVCPFIFLTLGFVGEYNIFGEKIVDYVTNTGNSENSREVNLSHDTRTFLYDEVFSSMVKRDSSFILGEGGGSAYETIFFRHTTLTNRGRYGSEVGFLNTLLYSGFVGVFLYMFILINAVFLSINRSNNKLSKMLGLLLTCHWVLFFLEDIVRYDMNFYFIWVAIGLCFSREFRSLSDLEIRQLLNFKLNLFSLRRRNRLQI